MPRLTLPGRPIAYPRTSISPQGRRVTPARYRQWLHAAAWEIRNSATPRDIAGPVAAEIIVGPDAVTVEISELDDLWKRPKGVRGDIDNYAKAALDASQFPIGGFPGWILNDRQVLILRARFSPDPLL